MSEYYGVELQTCFGKALDWLHAYAVTVSGARGNPYGHMLLNLGGIGGCYIHATGNGLNPIWYPFYLRDEVDFHRYLASGSPPKTVLKRFPLEITQPEAAQLKLECLLRDKYVWGVVRHNCYDFVKMIAEAGGSTDPGIPEGLHLPSYGWRYDYHDKKSGVGR